MTRAFVLAFLALAAAPIAPAADFASVVLEATFKFFHPDSTSTCVLFRREAPDASCYLVTTAHTLEKTKGETSVLVLREAKADGSYARRDLTIPVRHGNQPLWVRHPKQDVAVLRIADPLPVPITALPAASLADAAQIKASGLHLCSPLFILTYPERFEANGAGFPIARQGIVASPPQFPAETHPTFLADFTTFAGDSGGPVFIDGGNGQPLLVGIVLSQHNHEIRTKNGYEEKLVRQPLGIGTVLHAQYVREAIESAAKQPGPPPK